MTTRQERLAARKARIARQADTIIEEATERVVAARPAASGSQAEEVKTLRDGGMAWWVIGQKLGLADQASTASHPEAKRGAGRARALYAAANRGEVPRSHAPRKGTTIKPTGPGRGGTLTSRKEQLVREGYVIPRDLPDEEVEAMLCGRTISWAIDLARLTETDPATWGSGDTRWCKQEAVVHPEDKWVYVGEEDKYGNRLVRFREYLGRDNQGNLMAGPTRTVRVDAIYTIR
jgi:hypothetical protein